MPTTVSQSTISRLTEPASTCALMCGNSASRPVHCAAKSSSETPGYCSAVKRNRLERLSRPMTRVGQCAIAASDGPPYMSMTPLSGSATIRKKISPCGVTTLCLPPGSRFSSLQKRVAHFGRLSMRDRKSNVRCFGAESVRLCVLVFMVLSSFDRMSLHCPGMLGPETYEALQPAPRRTELRCRALAGDRVLDVRENALGNRLEAPGLGRQPRPRRAAVVRVWLQRHQPGGLDHANDRGHRLL